MRTLDWKDYNNAEEFIAKLMVKKAELEEENKKLKSDLAFKNTMLDNVSAEYDSSQDVIKKMKEERDMHRDAAKDCWYDIKELKERIRFLEQCLDNKEKVNKSLREENKRLSDFLECEA